MSFVTKHDSKGTITVSPRDPADIGGLVVLCHGLGDTAKGFLPIAEHISTLITHLKFVLPTAPTRTVTVSEMGMSIPIPSWFKIEGLEDKSKEQLEGIKESQARLEQILKHEHETTGLPYDRMILAGFSQGGTLSLFTGLQLSQKLAGIVCLSSILPEKAALQLTKGLEDTPILHCHGSQDEKIPYYEVIKSQAYWKRQGLVNYNLKSFPIKHSLSLEVIKAMYDFFVRIVPTPGPFITERHDDGTVTVCPKENADQSGLVIITHGLGDTGEGFTSVAEQIAKTMPHLKFILPTAPKMTLTVNKMGMTRTIPSWFDLDLVNEESEQDFKGIDKSQARLLQIMKTEHETTGLPYDRMVLAGFSQGGALSLYTGLQSPHKLAGIVCLSAFLPEEVKLSMTEGLEDTPILHCHGTQDDRVPYSQAVKTQAHWKEQGLVDYELKSFPSGHSVSMEMVKSITDFFGRILPVGDQYKFQTKGSDEICVKELKSAIHEVEVKE